MKFLVDPATLEALPTAWDLSSFYASPHDPRIEEDKRVIEARVEAFCATWEPVTDLRDASVAKRLLDDFTLFVSLGDTAGDPFVYAYLLHYVDKAQPGAEDLYRNTEKWMKALDARMAFVTPRIAALPMATRESFLADPLLADHHRLLGRFFALSPHIRPESEEKALKLLEDAAHDSWAELVRDPLSKESVLLADEEGGLRVVPFGGLGTYFDNPSASVRQEAAAALNGLMRKYAPWATKELNALMSYGQAMDEIRGYPTFLSSTLLGEEVPEPAFRAFLSELRIIFADVCHCFWDLKRQALGVERISYADRMRPLKEAEGQRFRLVEALELILDEFAHLDAELPGHVLGMFERRRVDMYPRPGKDGGGYTHRPIPGTGSYIQVNYGEADAGGMYWGKAPEVATLAHEFGHSWHNELAGNNPACGVFHAHPPNCLAEVASILLEIRVRRRLTQAGDPATVFGLLMHSLTLLVGQAFGTMSQFDFQVRLNEKFRQSGRQSREDISHLYRQCMEELYGDAVDCSGSEDRWVGLWHLRGGVYNWQYSFATWIAYTLDALIQVNPAAIQKVKRLFGYGSLLPPDQAVAEALGEDISRPEFWRAGMALVREEVAAAKKAAQGLGLAK